LFELVSVFESGDQLLVPRPLGLRCALLAASIGVVVLVDDDEILPRLHEQQTGADLSFDVLGIVPLDAFGLKLFDTVALVFLLGFDLVDLDALLDISPQRIGVREGERGQHERDDGGTPRDASLRTGADSLDLRTCHAARSGPATGTGPAGPGRSSSGAAGSSAGAHPPSLVDPES